MAFLKSALGHQHSSAMVSRSSHGALFISVLLAYSLLLWSPRAEATLIWSQWSTFSACPSISDCGIQPMQNRSRTCVDATIPDSAGGGCVGNASEQRPCGTLIPCSGYWSPWTNWTECMDICDSGEEKRFRECLSDNSTVVFPECVGGGPYVETRSCGVPTGQAANTEVQLFRLPAQAFVGGVSVLICCLEAASGSTLERFFFNQQQLVNRSGLYISSSLLRFDAVFTTLQATDSGLYGCQAMDRLISVRNIVLTVNDRPTTATTETPTTTAVTTDAPEPPSSPTVSTTTMEIAATTQGRVGGDGSGDDGGTSDTVWIAVFVPIGIILIVVVVIVFAVLWHKRSHQVLVGRRSISGEDSVQKIEVITARRVSLTKTKEHSQAPTDRPQSGSFEPGWKPTDV
eukprot:scpid10787/ scgid25988/ Brain-specific angiogenesis inhibitor 3